MSTFVPKQVLKDEIIVDNKIPYIHEAVEQIADEVVYLPGSGFTAGDVRDADALVIRTRTRCNRELLEGSKVKFIATATIGFDHIDVDYCDEAGIVWKIVPVVMPAVWSSTCIRYYYC